MDAQHALPLLACAVPSSENGHDPSSDSRRRSEQPPCHLTKHIVKLIYI
jgi:hypothetical protein